MKLKLFLLLAATATAVTIQAQSGKQTARRVPKMLKSRAASPLPADARPFKQSLEILYLSMDKTLIVTFQNSQQSILSVDVGSSNVAAEIINNKSAIRLMALKKDFKETNLTFYSGGRYYGYLLRYAPNQNIIVHYADAGKSLEKQLPTNDKSGGNGVAEEAATTQQVNKKVAALVASSNLEAPPSPIKSMDSVCRAILDNPVNDDTKYSDVNGGCKMAIGDCYVYRDKLYFSMRFTNTSSIAYDIDFVKFGTKFIKKTKNQAEQENDLTALYECDNTIETIAAGGIVEKVFVFEKFTIDKKTKRLKIEAWEKNGERVLNVYYPAKKIINATQL